MADHTTGANVKHAKVMMLGAMNAYDQPCSRRKRRTLVMNVPPPRGTRITGLLWRRDRLQ
jgi:hypothetical protein